MATAAAQTMGTVWRALRSAPKASFVICLVAYSLSQLDLALFAYAVPSIRKDLDIPLSTMGVIVGVSYALGGALMVWLAHLADSLGRKTVLMWGTVGAPLSVAATAIVPNAIALGGIRALSIALGGISYPATGALVTEAAPARVRGIMAGLLQTGYPIGWFAAAMFAAPLLTLYGWRALFLVALLWLPFVFVIRHKLVEPERKMTEGPKQSLRAAIGELLNPQHLPRVITLFVAQFLFVVAYGGVSIFFPTYFVEQRHLEIGSSAYLVGIGNAVGILGYALAAFTGEVLLTRRTTVVIWTLLGATLLLFMVWGTQNYVPTIAAFAVMSMFFSGTAAVKFAYVAEIFPSHLRATALAFCGSLAVNLGIGVGPILVTTAVERVGWNTALSLVGAIPMACAGLLYLFLKPIPSGLDVDEAARQAWK